MRLPGQLTTLSTLLLALAGCSSTSSASGAHPATSPSSATSADRTATGTLTISGDDSFAFSPAQATAKAGPVTIRFEGMGSYPHNIHFTSLGKTSASTTGGITGNTVTLSLGTLAPGTYAFVCDYHVGAGMKGVLTVR